MSVALRVQCDGKAQSCTSHVMVVSTLDPALARAKTAAWGWAYSADEDTDLCPACKMPIPAGVHLDVAKSGPCEGGDHPYCRDTACQCLCHAQARPKTGALPRIGGAR